MAFVYEINGQRIEFEKEPSEADIDEAAKSLGSAPQPDKTDSVGMPAMGARIPGTTGLGELAKDMSKVAVQTGRNYGASAIAPIMEAYRANPLKAGVTDLVTHAMTGLPLGSIYQGVKNLPERLDIAKQAMRDAGGALGKIPQTEWAQELAKGQFPGTADAFRDMRSRITQLDPDFSKQVAGALASGPTGRGNDAAVQKLLQQAPDVVKNDPRFAELAQKYASAVPSFGTKAMRVAEPLLRGLSKVAAPVGAALEGVQGYNQLQQGDYTGAALSGLGAASMFHPAGILAQPGLAILQSANQNFRQQTPEQQKESAMDALSGMVPGMAGEYFTQERNDAAEQRARTKQMQMQNEGQRIDMAIRLQAAKKALGPVAPTGR